MSKLGYRLIHFLTGHLYSVKVCLKMPTVYTKYNIFTEGDCDLPFPKLTVFSLVSRDIFGMESLSINAKGNLDLLCLPEKQLLEWK